MNPTPVDTALEEPIVEFEGVTKIYDAQAVAVQSITFTVRNQSRTRRIRVAAGTFFGCGKSTILRLIAGLRPRFPATKGAVRK